MSSACLVPAEDGVRDAGGITDAGRGFNFQRLDGSLRGDDAGGSLPDSGAQGGPDAAGLGASSGGANASSSSGGVGLDAGNVLDANGNGVDAGGGVGGPCLQWQDCQPHLGDPNSAYECVHSQCVCDPTGHWVTECGTIGGYFSAFDCYCVLGGSTPPNADPDPTDACGWTWEYYCEPDRWVDTSHYERRCETISGQTECRDVWVDSGRWEEGGCNHTRWVWKCR